MAGGGYQRPTKAAAVSGPGSLSGRTDGGVMDPDSPPYGEHAEIANLQAMAKPAMQNGAGSGPAVAAGTPASFDDLISGAGIHGLSDPSANPMPVTSGAAAGAGPGPAALGLPQTLADEKRADVQALPEGMLAAMVLAADSPDATPSFRRTVREILAYS